ncbi:hypothetical protein K505DRAFT_287001, partial [Melanomma pulvis-pyrius CBS 109.77]
MHQPHVPQVRYGTLPTAFEYEDYLHWCAQKRECYRPVIPDGDLPQLEYSSSLEIRRDWRIFQKAEKCKHPLHPTHPANFAALKKELNEKENMDDEEDGEVEDEAPRCLRCPVCTMRAHLNFNKALLEKWADIGGPWRELNKLRELLKLDPKGRQYDASKKANHRAKVDMINTVHEFEDWAEAEKNWEVDNWDTHVRAVEQYSAGEAVRIFYDETKFPAILASNALGQCTPTPEKPKKKLAFTPDTSDTKNRPRCFYSRNCITYDPDSPHSCLDEDGWDNTSFHHDHLYAISQCRILRVVYEPGCPYLKYYDLNAGKDRGDNMHVTRLQKEVADWVESREARTEWINYLATASDIFLVLKEDWTDGDDWDRFEIVSTLAETRLAPYARLIGDLEDD